MNRKKFIQNASILGAGVGLNGFLSPLYGMVETRNRVTILHTNDTHARIEPFPDNSPIYPGLGGIARRASLVKQLRRENPNSLLLDAGDIFFGTSYFNKYGGALDLEIMSKMGYDASTIGNHEFDNGVGGFEKVMNNAKFPFVSSNYDFGTTNMGHRIQKFIIRRVAGVKIGIFGLGVSLENRMAPDLYRGVRYLDPVEISGKMVKLLRDYHHCDMIICLSHIGYQYKNSNPSDSIVADQIDGIDLIIGGHTHTLMDKPELIEKNNGSRTWITQVGLGGVVLGRLDFYFDRNRKIAAMTHFNHAIAPTALINHKF